MFIQQININNLVVEHTIKIPQTGEILIFELSASKIKNFRGQPAMVEILRDISDRKEAEAEKNRYVSIVTDSNDAIVGTDLKGIITSWNQSAEKIFGYTSEEIIGKSVKNLTPPDRYEENVMILKLMRYEC